jgi:hypothetical protein
MSSQLQFLRSDAKGCDIEIAVAVNYAITQMHWNHRSETIADHRLDKGRQLGIRKTLLDNVTGRHCKHGRSSYRSRELNFGCPKSSSATSGRVAVFSSRSGSLTILLELTGPARRVLAKCDLSTPTAIRD